MRKPLHATLLDRKEDGPSVVFATGSPTLSGNPRFYKYLWQIFSRESQHEGDEFFEHAPLVCTAEMVLETQRLIEAGLTCFLYGFARPREGTGIRDMNHPRWRNTMFAPSWQDDTDPLTIGGHK